MTVPGKNKDIIFYVKSNSYDIITSIIAGDPGFKYSHFDIIIGKFSG